MPGNVQSVSNAIDQMVESLGLSKLADTGEPVGESAGTVADSGTTHPAEQETNEANIMPATGGERAAEHAAVQKEEVPGTSTAESSPSDAENTGAESSTENATSATYVGEDPSVEDGYDGSGYDPGTSHPADLNKNPEKYSAQLLEDSSFLLGEIQKIAEKGKADYSGDDYMDESADPKKKKVAKEEPKSEEKGDSDSEEKEATGEESTVTVADRISELALGKQASTEVERDLVTRDATSRYLQGYVKTASILGDLTADYLDVHAAQLQKQAMPGMEEMGGMEDEMGGAMLPADELAGDQEAEAAALAAAAEEVAAELGVSPEEVLQAAMAEAEGGDLGGMGVVPEAEVAAPPAEAMAGPEEAMMEEAAATDGDEGLSEEEADDSEEKEALAKLAEMAQKAQAFDHLVAKQAADEERAATASSVKQAVTDGMREWFQTVNASK